MDGHFPLPDDRQGRTPAGDIDPRALANEIEARGRTWADLKATAKLLELTIPMIRAALVQKYLDQGKTESGRRISRADAIDLALLDAEFQTAQEAAIDGRMKANIAEAEFTAVQARADLMRTVEATRRAEMQNQLR